MAYRLEINETNEPFGKVPGRDAFEVQMRLYDSGQYVNSVAAEISGQTVKALGGAASLIPALATVLLLEASPFVAQALGDRRLPLSDPSATFTVILPFEQIDRRLRSAPIDRTSVELVPLEVAPFLRVPSEPRRFGVRNFRSIGDERQSVELRPVTVLVGPNGSGKSNLFNALDALARLCRGHLVPPNWQHRLPTGAVQPTATLTFSWQVSDEGVSREFEYEVELGSRSYQDFIVRESLVEQPNGTVWIHTDGRTTRYRSALPATTDGTFADLQHPIPREHTAVRWLGDQRAFPASSSLRSLMEGFAIHEPWRGPSRNFHGDDRFLTGDGTNLPAVLRRLLRSGPIAKQLDEDLSHAVGEGSHLIDVDEANWQARISGSTDAFVGG